jgi:hypothetical protein
MQTSRFQLGLIATLAVGLGFSLASSEAVGYPAGGVVSLGTNPVIAKAGSVNEAAVEVLEVPTESLLVVTDLLLTMKQKSCGSRVSLVTGGGEIIAKVDLHSHSERIDVAGSTYTVRAALSNSQPTTLQHAFSSGLPVNGGDTLTIIETGGCDVAYTLSGYYAQP